MEDATVVTIAELIHNGRAVTGASSLYVSSCLSTSHFSFESNGRNPLLRAGFVESDMSYKCLNPVSYPAILFGTLALPSETLECPNRYCLRFSDGNWTICCDIIGLEARAIGKKICVLAWNFLPMEHRIGFLEIVKWKLLDTGNSLVQCSSIDSVPLVPGSRSREKADSKSRYGVHGVIESTSPVSVVPCSIGCSTKQGDSSGPVTVRGFLVRVMACECKLCSSKAVLKSEDYAHSFAKPVFIYFSGSMAVGWHPVIIKLVGSIIVLTGMKKKPVYISETDSLLVLVTTENSVLYSPGFSKKRLGSRTIVEKGNCRSYLGTVKGVYMGGKLIEMDEDVWLLLTDRTQNRPHSVRVGSLICVRNVHFVDTEFPWGKILILGTCFKTSITVELFSPFETSCLVDSHMQNSLSEFIETLSFPARFWTLFVISCFQNFTGISTGKEIFGPELKDELIKTYVMSHIPSSMFQPRRRLFPEFCMHESRCCNTEAYYCNLKLVVPVSSFTRHYTAMLNELLLDSKKDESVFLASNCFRHLASVGKTYGHSATKILRGESIGVVLLGRFKISSSSGRLQLHDEIASIDVLLPDFPSNTGSSIYEVTDYSLVIEGTPELMLHMQSPWKPFSCRSVFDRTPLTTESALPMFISLCSGDSNCRNVLLHPSLGLNHDLKDLKGGTFHIFRVTHKFPILQNGDPMTRESCSVFLEAVIFPWDLHESMALTEKHSNNRHKTEDTSKREQVLCQVTIRSANNHSSVTMGTLCSAKGNRNSIKHGVKRVLLEFISARETYNLLQIGGCYLMKHGTEDSFCFGRFGIYNNDKIIFRPESRVWSLDFSFDKVQHHSGSADDFSVVNGQDKVLPTQTIPRPFSDVSLHLPYDAKSLFSAYLKDEEDVDISVTMGEETSNVPSSSSARGAKPSQECLFPEGHLTTFRGDVVAINTNESGVTGYSCIHVLLNQEHVKIFGSLSRHSYLTGFGPGVNATFYRIVRMKEGSKFLMSPASFIKINMLKAMDKPVAEDPSHVAASCASSTMSHEIIPAGWIYGLVSEIKDNQAINLACKVLSVHLVILQRSLSILSDTQSEEIIDIPLAGFVIDDGSSTCLCWARGKSAYAFLRLSEEFPKKAMSRGAWMGRDSSSQRNIAHHLEQVVKKHNRIVIKNKASQIHTLVQDVTISVGSHHPLSNSEDKLLKLLILNVISGHTLTVTVSTMDKMRRQMEREVCVEMETTKLPLKNVWGTQVSTLDPLVRAKTLLQGLLNR